jgi:2,3-bisphosphoglycerate-independent phosphoglycerate mutase
MDNPSKYFYIKLIKFSLIETLLFGETVKAIIIIGDGMADRPLRELNHLTPLEAVETKNMDWLASCGVSGLLYSTWPSVAPNSDVANLAILGYPYDVYAGRGGFEAAGAGIQLGEGDVAFRCDFATVNEENTRGCC